MENKNKKKWIVGGLLFCVCMFLGAALGKIYNDLEIGALIGMAAGLLIMAIIKFRN